MISCSFLVIGGGETGINTALKIAKFSSEVILVEENEIGGSWLYSLEYPFYCWSEEINSNNLKNQTEKILQTNEKIGQKLDQKQEKIIDNLQKSGVKIVYGKASFISKSMMEVNSENEHEIINFKQVIICTGKNNINMPELTGIEDINFLYQHNIFSIKEIPKSLAIIDCSIFGLEIAYLYSSFGCKVDIFDTGNIRQILRFFDSTCLNWTFQELLKKNISFHFETKISKVIEQNNQIKLFDNNKNSFLTDKIFVFAKESFDGDKLALSKIGIKFDNKGIITAQNGQTIQRNIYAIGNSAQNYKKENLYSVINGLCQTFCPNEDKKTNSIILFGSNSDKNSFEIHKISLSEPVFSLGMSYRAAETRWGAIIQFEIYKSLFDSGFAKITYNSINGQILGIGLTGKIAQDFHSICINFLSKNTNHKEAKNFFLNNALNLE